LEGITYTVNELKSTYLDTISIVHSLIACDQVATRWHEPSVLREYSVGGLAGHLAGAALSPAALLAEPPTEDEGCISAVGYVLYFTEHPGWTDIYSPLHTAIRQRSEARSVNGHGQLVAELAGAVQALQERLGEEPDGRPLRLLGVTVRLDGFLETRLVECIVHSDDLAASVGLPTPSFSQQALDISINTLVNAARHQHGDLAVLRALTRRERDTVEALRLM
jgi:hypothetical protein